MFSSTPAHATALMYFCSLTNIHTNFCLAQDVHFTNLLIDISVTYGSLSHEGEPNHDLIIWRLTCHLLTFENQCVDAYCACTLFC